MNRMRQDKTLFDKNSIDKKKIKEPLQSLEIV